MTPPVERFTLAVPFPLYDPAVGESGALRKVVSAEDYLHAVQLMMHFRLAMKRLQIVVRNASPARDVRILTEIADTLKKRMEKAEAQLWVHSDGQASYFDEYPVARPPDSLRELGPRRHL